MLHDEPRPPAITFLGMRQLVRAEWTSWERQRGDSSCPAPSLTEFSVGASLSSLLESSSHSSSEGSGKSANHTHLTHLKTARGSCRSVQGQNVNRPQTFAAAHVDDELQSRLLSREQRCGLSQFLVSGLKKQKQKQPTLNAQEHIFTRTPLVKAYEVLSASGIRRTEGRGAEVMTAEGQTASRSLLAPGPRTVSWLCGLRGDSERCLVSCRKQINIREF